MKDNPLLCKACFGSLAKRGGGAEVEISVLFADVRGSTGLAERISPDKFRRLLQDYYVSASRAIDQNGGIVDKFLGDGVMALFIPVKNHAGRAIEAGRAVLASAERDGLVAKGLMIGAGVHTGEAFVGVVGANERVDFTALGDTVNVRAAGEPRSVGPGTAGDAADGARGGDRGPRGNAGRRLDRSGAAAGGRGSLNLPKRVPG
jgi:adenylate cyclase